MFNQKLRNVIKKGLPTALLEVVLIFLGISLAIGLDNWNAEHKEREDELELLAELKSNLEENLNLLQENISFNEETVSSYETVLAHIAAKKPYFADLSANFARLDTWASPFMTSSAYETLRGRGLDLVSNSALRQQIVQLFEVNYVLLASDYDRAEWLNHEVSTIPLMLKHFEDQSRNAAVPVDYESLLEDQGFRVASRRTLKLRKSGIWQLKESVEATKDVIKSISNITSH